MRDGTRRRHPGRPILPLLIIEPHRREYRCLACGRPLHFDRRRREWRQHVRPWFGRQRP